MNKKLIAVVLAATMIAGCTKPNGDLDWVKTGAVVVGTIILGGVGGSGSPSSGCVPRGDGSRTGDIICH